MDALSRVPVPPALLPSSRPSRPGAHMARGADRRCWRGDAAAHHWPQANQPALPSIPLDRRCGRLGLARAPLHRPLASQPATRVPFAGRLPRAPAMGVGAGARAAAGAGRAGAEPLTYKDAGVDIDAGAELVRRIAKMTPGIGGFGGLFPFGDSYLVAGTDGVGTKLKLAFALDKHDTIGVDLVAMSVNDIVTSGAKPLFFLDYFASSRLDVDQAEQVIRGIVDGCKQSDCALLGGETAEMPGFYADGEYDLSGFAVGAVKKEELIDGRGIAAGDAIVALPSSGLHSNGFSLARRVVETSGVSLADALPGGGGDVTIGEALLAPTTIYVRQVLELIRQGGVKGIAHITGGGFTENIPRVIPQGLAAEIDASSWQIPPVFKWLQQAGGIEEAEMRRTFNLGVGMVLVTTEAAAEAILRGENGGGPAFRLGRIVPGDGVVFVDGL